MRILLKKLILETIKEEKLTLNEISDLTNISKQKIKDYIKNNKKITLKEAMRIYNVLKKFNITDITFDELITGQYDNDAVKINSTDIKSYNNIQELRIKKNITQKELANVLGVHRNTISKWECGYAIPSKKRIEEMSMYFKNKVEVGKNID